MKLKLMFGLIFVLLLSGLALAEVDKVVVVNYDSMDQMMQDVNKLKPVKKVVQEDSTLKTWTYCKRHYCYQVPVIEQIVPVKTYTHVTPVLTHSYVTTHAHVKPVRKYHYNPSKGQYTNDWDAIEDHYREHHRYDRQYDHEHSRRSYRRHHSSHHWH